MQGISHVWLPEASVLTQASSCWWSHMGTETTTDVEELQSYGPWGTISGWWLTCPSEKYESQLGWWHSQLNGSQKNHVPNHQPDIIKKTFWRLVCKLSKTSFRGLRNDGTRKVIIILWNCFFAIFKQRYRKWRNEELWTLFGQWCTQFQKKLQMFANSWLTCSKVGWFTFWIPFIPRETPRLSKINIIRMAGMWGFPWVSSFIHEILDVLLKHGLIAGLSIPVLFHRSWKNSWTVSETSWKTTRTMVGLGISSWLVMIRACQKLPSCTLNMAMDNPPSSSVFIFRCPKTFPATYVSLSEDRIHKSTSTRLLELLMA